MQSSFATTLTLRTCAFYLIWLLLSESFDALHMVMGVVVAFGVAWLNTERIPSGSPIRVGRMLRYIPWLVVRVLHSGVHLSVLILRRDLPIHPQVIRHRTNLSNEASVVLLGNSITLTPGTITVEVDGQDLIVHSIDESAGEDVTSRRIEQRIDGIFVTKDGK